MAFASSVCFSTSLPEGTSSLLSMTSNNAVVHHEVRTLVHRQYFQVCFLAHLALKQECTYAGMFCCFLRRPARDSVLWQNNSDAFRLKTFFLGSTDI